jgi:hypothetical protein
MSIAAGPSIVTSGLVLDLDARNTRSYPGTGTTWSDVSNTKADWALPLAGTYNSSGYMAYASNQSAVSAAPAWYANTTEMTIECIYNPVNPYSGCCETVFGTYWFRFFQINAGMYTMIGFNNGAGASTYQHPVFSIGLNQWHHCVGMRRNNNFIIWIDGVEMYNTNWGTGLSFYDNSGAWYVGGAAHPSINIATARIYNRGLTDAELTQNFNATRTIYGI